MQEYETNSQLYKVNVPERKLSIEIPKYDNLTQQFEYALEIVEDVVLKNYITKLEDMDVMPINDDNTLEDTINNLRMFNINKIVYAKDEDTTYKLVNVLNAVAMTDSSIFIIIDSDGKKTDFYMGVHSHNKDKSATTSFDTLASSMRGHFPGIKVTDKDRNEIKKLLSNHENKSLSTVTGVANFKNEELKDNSSFIQGLEKLALTMGGNEYTGILLATPQRAEKTRQIRHQYEDLYTKLSAFENLQFSYGENSSFNKGTTSSNSESYSESDTENSSESQTMGSTSTENESLSISKNTKSSRQANYLAASLAATGATIGTIAGPAGTATGAFLGLGIGGTIGGFISAATQSTENTTIGTSQSKSETDTQSHGTSHGITASQTRGKTISEGSAEGETKGIQLTTQNKMVQNHLKRIDYQLDRLEEAESLGLWESAAYFISNDTYATEIAASTYKSIIQGEQSGVEVSSISRWSPGDFQLKKLHKYVEALRHPVFIYNNQSMKLPISPTSLVNSRELAIQMALPRSSVPGFPVVDHSLFAQEVIKYDNEEKESIDIGHLFHMGEVKDERIKLDLESLSMHTLITGSTGSGKSNTIYTLINQMILNDINFMVVEPAKGEYRATFGNNEDVTVFGTNPMVDRILKISPFKFPEKVHVLEHIDRLVEIFNVCWPMYAAMPAILKEAIIKSYEEKGWDLDTSFYLAAGSKVFPTFEDLLINLETVIDASEFHGEVKSNYKGSLITRVKSLTNGLYRQIFDDQENDNKQLFDSNVIVDLSRIGSSETKSLLMGILIMRMNEYRASEKSVSNERLKHVTILEEAHHILKRTSTEQSNEGSNMIGKSVEMLSNSIAEMRTYGEGFIIADQSPNMLDASAIRNTNTKIILRMMDEEDRKIVGKSTGLNDEQIKEIIKFPRGVGVVYQNDWLEPVLCKFDQYKLKSSSPFNETPSPENISLVLSYILSIRKSNTVRRKKFDQEEIIEIYNNKVIRSFLHSNFIYEEINEIVLESTIKKSSEIKIAELITKLVNLRGIESTINRNVQGLKDEDIKKLNKILNIHIQKVTNDLDRKLIKKYVLKYLNESTYSKWLSLIRDGVIK